MILATLNGAIVFVSKDGDIYTDKEGNIYTVGPAPERSEPVQQAPASNDHGEAESKPPSAL